MTINQHFMFSKNNQIIILFGFLLILTSCGKSKYAELVHTEMATNVVHDSLFLGMKFGQTKKEFFDLCWNLNKEKLVVQGPNNKFVQYKLPVKEGRVPKSNIIMLFYGRFNDENIMTGMDMQFYYDGWSIWNKEFQSDNLLPKIKDSLESWYPGNDFVNISMPNNKELLVKVDGNRRITIRPIDDKKIVKAQIDDLRYVLDN